MESAWEPGGGGHELRFRPLSHAGRSRRRDSNPRTQSGYRRNPCLRIRPTRLRSIVVGCEATIRTRIISWFRARRGAGCTSSHRSGRRDSNSQPPAPRAGALPLRHIQLAGTDGRIRTDTGGGLSAVPLPVGLRQHWWTERESNPHPPPCKGVTLPVALPARGGGGGDRTRTQGV